MTIHYKKSTKSIQSMHGVRDWNQNFRLENSEFDCVIRAVTDNDEVIGQIAVDKEWIFFLSVKPEYRHYGIGSKLMTLAEEQISYNYDIAYLRPQKEFIDTLIPWYQKQGYKISKDNPTSVRYSDRKNNNLFLIKNISYY